MSPIQRARKGQEDYPVALKVLGGLPGGLGGVGRPSRRSGSLTLMSGRGWEDFPVGREGFVGPCKGLGKVGGPHVSPGEVGGPIRRAGRGWAANLEDQEGLGGTPGGAVWVGRSSRRFGRGL